MDEETCDSSLSEPDLGCDSELSPFGSANLYSVPAGTRVKSFVGEGAANVVVELELPQGAPATTKHFFQGRLAGSSTIFSLVSHLSRTPEN